MEKFGDIMASSRILMYVAQIFCQPAIHFGIFQKSSWAWPSRWLTTCYVAKLSNIVHRMHTRWRLYKLSAERTMDDADLTVDTI